MSDTEYEFETSSANRSGLRAGEALVDSALEAGPALLRQADKTLDALAQARQRAADRRAARDALRSDISRQRSKGLS